MYVNGIIVQKKIKQMYQGVDGDNWYFNYDESFSSEFKNYFENLIEKSWYDNSYVDVCNDATYIKKYVELSLERQIEYRLLLCMTEQENPQMTIEIKEKKFLGYDYAYSGGSYYSAILNDVVSKRIPEFKSLKLNSNGLFETLEEICDFVKFRELLKRKYQEYTFEEGDFLIYKLYEVISYNDI